MSDLGFPCEDYDLGSGPNSVKVAGTTTLRTQTRSKVLPRMSHVRGAWLLPIGGSHRTHDLPPIGRLEMDHTGVEATMREALHARLAGRFASGLIAFDPLRFSTWGIT